MYVVGSISGGGGGKGGRQANYTLEARTKDGTTVEVTRSGHYQKMQFLEQDIEGFLGIVDGEWKGGEAHLESMDA